jgi:Icc-related predicted phosphoesterase
MKLLYTSDIHASPTHLSSMLTTAEERGVDAIIIGGDIIPHHLPDTRNTGILAAQAAYLRQSLVPAVQEFKKKTECRLYMDLGNDDFISNRPVLEEYDEDLFYLLHNKKHRLTDGVDILGYMIVPPTPFDRKDWEKADLKDTPYPSNNGVRLSGVISTGGQLERTRIDLSSPDTIEKDLNHLSQLIENPFILVAHSPPYNTPLDVLYNGVHAGSLALSHFVDKWSSRGKLVASLHGHIHESPRRSGTISTTINSVPCINPGQGNGPGAPFRYVILKLREEQSSTTIDIVDNV